MGGQVGGAVTASLTPYIAARYGWNSAFVVAAILALIGASLWLLIDPTEDRGGAIGRESGAERDRLSGGPARELSLKDVS